MGESKSLLWMINIEVGRKLAEQVTLIVDSHSSNYFMYGHEYRRNKIAIM